MTSHSSEKHLDIRELPPELKELVGECELTGRRTLFHRAKRPVAILISHDEYVALRETIAIAGDKTVTNRIAAAEAQVGRGAVLLPEDLFGE